MLQIVHKLTRPSIKTYFLFKKKTVYMMPNSHCIDKEETMKWENVKSSGTTKAWNGGENLSESNLRAILTEVTREVILRNVLL